MASETDRAIALLDLVNGLRVMRDDMEAVGLAGLADDIDQVKAKAGREFAAITADHFMRVPDAVAARIAR